MENNNINTTQPGAVPNAIPNMTPSTPPPAMPNIVPNMMPNSMNMPGNFMGENTNDLRNMVQETLNFARENNNILKKMRRAQRRTFTLHLIYWIIILGISVGAYYFAKPYFDKAMALYTQGAQNFTNFKDFFKPAQGVN